MEPGMEWLQLARELVSIAAGLAVIVGVGWGLKLAKQVVQTKDATIDLLREERDRGITEEPHVGRIKLSARYRAHGLWFYTRFQWYDAHVWDAGVTQLTPL